MSTSTKQGALIFLHGLGDTPAGWSSLENQLPQMVPRLSGIEFVFPPAPIMSITINGGATMPGWFDLYDWPIGVGSKDDEKNKLLGVQQIEACIKKLEEKGIPRNRIVVGGFSQGGAIALLSAYYKTDSAQGPLAGCAVMSGWLTLVDDKGSQITNTETPLFWGHGQFDDKVLFEQQAHGVSILSEAGVSIEQSSYPIGHSADYDELQRLAAFLDRTLFDATNSEL